jgi:two-component system chemotaxis response regulator CheY
MGHCLIVDDSSVVRKVARRIVEDMKFRITEAENGEEALDQCRLSMPDAVLLDWNMPVMDGIEFLRSLRASEGGTRPRVILCTMENDEEHIRRAFDAGADEYIMKPFDREILQTKFREAGLIR